MLFNYATGYIMRRSVNNFRKIHLGQGSWISDLELAEDIALFGDQPATVHSVVDWIVWEAMAVGLKINIKNEVFHYFTRSVTLYPHQRRHFATNVSLQILGHYYPTDRPSQGRSRVPRRPCQESFLITSQSVVVSQRTKAPYEIVHLPRHYQPSPFVRM